MSSHAKKALNLVLAALPTIAFIFVNYVCTLKFAVIAAIGAGVIVFCLQMLRRESLRAAVYGLIVAVICGAIAASTGEARDFFLAPALIPFAVIVACVGSILVGRPLTGLLLNKACGGPSAWWDDRPLRKIYAGSTWTAAAISVLNGALQVTFYMADKPVILAAIHVATAPVFATLTGVVIVLVRRELARRRAYDVGALQA